MTSFTGTVGDESQAGGSGDDSFDYSQGGEDTLVGGAGNDSFFMGAAFDAGDRIKGGKGDDSLTLQGDYSAGVSLELGDLKGIEDVDLNFGFTYRIALGERSVHGGAILAFYAFDAGSVLDLDASALTRSTVQVLFGGASDNRITGGAGRDFLSADSAAFDRSNVIDGGAGFDSFTADYGLHLRAAAHSFQNIEEIFLATDSELVLDDGNAAAGGGLNILTGFNGAYLVDGHKETDAGLGMSGQGGTVHFIGGGMGDMLTGGAGDDTVQGGLGAHTLGGGAGADDFVFARLRDSWHGGVDLVSDLAADDRIDLSAIDANLAKAGQQHFNLVEAFTGHAGQLTLSYDGASTWLRGDADGDGRADLVVRILGDHHDFAGLILG